MRSVGRPGRVFRMSRPKAAGVRSGARKVGGILAGCVLSLLPLCIGQGAQARALADIRASGHLNIGVNPALPPLAAYDSRNVIEGFDVDVGTALAARLGVSPRLVPVSSSGRIPYLMAGKVDVVLGGLTRTPERAAAIAFSAPLYAEEFAIIAPAVSRVGGLDDLASGRVRMVEVRGSTAVPFLRTHAPKAPILLLGSYPDAVRALAQGRGDAMVDVIEYVGRFLAAEPQAGWTIQRGFAPAAGEDCVGVAQSDTDLLRVVDGTLADLKRDGTIQAAYRRWFGVSMATPAEGRP
ncbi:amino acid ABC transporter substrate-binding protein (PAAT family) [Gluconacetobacter diazotrophicus]|nr:amino acid ABC transporter substrate-binding protein (PAAT family) [Gluconacetobacter diazotrophicus]